MMDRKTLFATIAAVHFALLNLAPIPALAVGEDEELSDSIDLAQAVRLIDAERFSEALPILQHGIQRTPDDADFRNYLGFTLRKLGALDEAYEQYQIALDLDPDHKGAHEYLGELFLMRDDLESAQAMLAEFDRLCPAGCEEREELAEAIEEYTEHH